MARKGMSVTSLAEHLDISRQTLSRLLNSRQSIDIDDLERIGMVLGIDPDSLLARAMAA